MASADSTASSSVSARPSANRESRRSPSCCLSSPTALPGLGRTAVVAVDQYDLPIVQGVVVFGTVAIILFNLAVDVLYAFIDRIRLD